MTRDEEAALVHVWLTWRTGRALGDEVYLEFYEAQVRNNPQYAGIHVFEVVDALVNATEPDRRESA